MRSCTFGVCLIGWSAALSAIPASAQISFAPVELYDAGDSPSGLQVADLNGDGFPEIIVSDGSSVGLGRLVVLTNDGTGHFLPPVGQGPRFNGARLAVGDLDNDGDNDVAAFGINGNFWYDNDGAGNLTERALPDAYVTHRTGVIGVALLDYNRDGTLDIGIVTQLGDMEFVANLGNGTFGDFHRRHLYDTSPYNASNWPTAIDAVDLDGDGFKDFVVASHANRTFIRLEWIGGHRFAPFVMRNVGRVDSVAYGELDGMPGIDAVFTHDAPAAGGSDSPGLWIDCNDGYGGLTRCVQLRRALGIGFVEAVATGDFDGDGRVEIVASLNDLSGVVVAARSETGIWSTVVTATTGALASLLAVDVDGDGKPDIVAGHSQVGVLRNTTP